MFLQQSTEHVTIVYTCNNLFCSALVHVMYSGVSGQCSDTLHYMNEYMYKLLISV